MERWQTLSEMVTVRHLIAPRLKLGAYWDWSVSLYGELLDIAGGKERIRFYLNQYQPNFEPPTNLDKFIADLHAAKTKHYQQLVATGAIPLRPGVKRLLEEARTQGMRLAIATTAALPNVTALLQHTLAPDAPEWFEVIAAGDIVPAKKPAPDIYQYVLRVMGLSAQDCLAIEDSHHGLKAAAGVGLKTVIIVNDYTRSQDFSGARLVLNHLGEPDLPFTVLAGDAGDISYLNQIAPVPEPFSEIALLPSGCDRCYQYKRIELACSTNQECILTDSPF